MIFKVRLGTPSDVPAIKDLEKQADTAAHWNDEIYNTLFEAGGVPRLVLLADANRSIAGFMVIRAVGDEWELENVVVALHLRRRGIASALMTELLKRAQQAHVHHILLEVRQSNASARALYAKTGFVECGRRPRYYQEPEEDAICYRHKVVQQQTC